MKRLLVLVATLFTLAAVQPASAADPAALVAAKRTMQQAAYSTPDAATAARGLMAALSAAEPKSATLHYWVALADYRIAPLYMSSDKKKAEEWIKDGLSHLDQATKLDAKSGEALALRAALMGLSIGIEPSRGMALGPQIEEVIGSARKLIPDSPRLALVEGINTLNKPRFVGGGADKALTRLQRAQELFANEHFADSTAIDWGRDDAFVWAGRAAVKLKKYDEARANYQKALEISPGNGWVRFVLIPELEKSVAGKEKS